MYEYTFVKVHGCRSARVTDGFLVDREGPLGVALEESVPSQKRDNHIVAVFVDYVGTYFFAMISDSAIRVGTQIERKHW